MEFFGNFKRAREVKDLRNRADKREEEAEEGHTIDPKPESPYHLDDRHNMSKASPFNHENAGVMQIHDEIDRLRGEAHMLESKGVSPERRTARAKGLRAAADTFEKDFAAILKQRVDKSVKGNLSIGIAEALEPGSARNHVEDWEQVERQRLRQHIEQLRADADKLDLMNGQ